jgi:hypothetical protein
VTPEWAPKVNPGVRPGEPIVAAVALINLHVNFLAFEVVSVAAENQEDSLFFKLCSDHLSIEAIPRRTIRVDIAELKCRAIVGLELMLWTPHFVVLRNHDGQEITLRRDGRMIIRKAESEPVARRAASEVMNAVCVVSKN